MKDRGRAASFGVLYLWEGLSSESAVLSSPRVRRSVTRPVSGDGRSACFSDGFSVGLNDAKIVRTLQRLARRERVLSPTPRVTRFCLLLMLMMADRLQKELQSCGSGLPAD